MIQQSEPNSKRRRNVEPGAGPSASVAGPSRGQYTHTGLTRSTSTDGCCTCAAIFRFAETVPADSFDTANQTKQITVSSDLPNRAHSQHLTDNPSRCAHAGSDQLVRQAPACRSCPAPSELQQCDPPSAQLARVALSQAAIVSPRSESSSGRRESESELGSGWRR